MRRTTSSLSLVAITTGLLLAVTPVVQANDWDYNLGIWAWGPTVKGSFNYNVTGQEGGIEISPDDILSDVNFVGMATFEAHSGSWSVLADVFYLNASNKKKDAISLPFGSGGEVDTRVKMTMTSWVTGLSGAYDLYRSDEGSVALLLGVRYTEMDSDLFLSATEASSPLVDEALRSKATSFDGVIGFKGHFGLGGEWFVPWLADIGTGDSDLTWQAAASVGYHFHWGDLALSYRYLDYEMKAGSSFEQVSFSGPAINVNFHF